MLVNICFKFIENASGGGNQFLKALRDSFNEKGIYTDDPSNADIILFNSYQEHKQVLNNYKKYYNKIFVHRVDGLTMLYNHKYDLRDKITLFLNKMIADGSIYQSKWCYKKYLESGMDCDNQYEIIINAPNENLFYAKTNFNEPSINKIKIVATSWSSNKRKGFSLYEYLDNKLDFDKFDFTFVGNSPIKFRNINHVQPVNSEKLSEILKDNHIYITASENDACSNSLLEAIHCGLYPIALNDGGHPEIISYTNGCLFEGENDVINKLNQAYEHIKDKKEVSHNLPLIDDITTQYINFFKKIIYCSNKNVSLTYRLKAILKINFVTLVERIIRKLNIYG